MPKHIVNATIGAIGSTVAHLYGGWSEDLTTLLIFMVVDYITGLAIAGLWKSSQKSESGALNSNSAWKGLVKKGISLLVVLIAHRLDMSLGMDYIKTGVVICFISNETMSIVENLGIMGVPLPNKLIKSIEVLKEKE